ncbi:hypothetical protein BEWA_005700 [Theileria equi strain WA]|uniref:Uncharacterized protein n=1 Tax=Theileria equi strain WA TaxID=1537102 RepID=L0AZX5_THEEQ|nr:hypothetical protein BEWA_005700 [Theileria equi strain WA]AFZ81162.1 hypothetical protein BEWA_005700 [Theileria equi strain WA]|eukprot:XP_004830828.1 hypothetical protein BEWA_005700 [Theileria equi strain WA]
MGVSLDFIGRGVSRLHSSTFRRILGVSQRCYGSTSRTLFASGPFNHNNFCIKPSRPFMRSAFMGKCEANCSRKIYIENNVVKEGVPLYTFFTLRVCLTFRIRKDEITGEPVLVLSGMTRDTDGTGVFDKFSRTVSILTIDNLKAIHDTLNSQQDALVTMEGTDNSEVVVSKTAESFSIQLTRDPLKTLESSAMVLQASKNKPNINFSGPSDEAIILVHSIKKILDHLSQHTV